jgi:hypothetical protein
MQLIPIDPSLTQILPETGSLLASGHLVIHPRVRAVVLSGSRGLRGGNRADSDIDLSLIVDVGELLPGPELGSLLSDVLQTTLQHWTGPVELDLAAVFDTQACGLVCFGQPQLDLSACGGSGRDCFGIYKTQHGFHGFVPPIGVTVNKMSPTLTVWRRGYSSGTAGGSTA